MNTDELTERLVQTLEPVSRLRPPPARTALWFALGIPYVALVVVVMSPRSDLFAKLSDPSYVIEQSAALATGSRQVWPRSRASYPVSTVEFSYCRSFRLRSGSGVSVWAVSSHGFNSVWTACHYTRIGSASRRSCSSAWCRPLRWP